MLFVQLWIIIGTSFIATIVAIATMADQIEAGFQCQIDFVLAEDPGSYMEWLTDFVVNQILYSAHHHLGHQTAHLNLA